MKVLNTTEIHLVSGASFPASAAELASKAGCFGGSLSCASGAAIFSLIRSVMQRLRPSRTSMSGDSARLSGGRGWGWGYGESDGRPSNHEKDR